MPGKEAVMHLCGKGLYFVSFYDFSSEFYNCADSSIVYALLVFSLWTLSKIIILKNTFSY